jgi:hypothetical protein
LIKLRICKNGFENADLDELKVLYAWQFMIWFHTMGYKNYKDEEYLKKSK